jgi:hypothetical protein
MISNSQLLTQTLVQRGESDNYIRSRLLIIGLTDEEAKQLIHQSRQHSNSLVLYPTDKLEITLLVSISLAFMIFLVWFLLSSLRF